MGNFAKEQQTGKSNPMSQSFKISAQESEQSLERISHGVGERVGAMATNFAEKTSEYIQSGREYVKESPVKSVAIAAAAGAVAGSLLTMAMRRKH
ncbi:MAG: hypothetical protein BroJett040_05100 [Oligoflexia bacterium]|nr:MAG: hypothetical protein BroJett040_05100 [Oligoflexia bacterium]